jgi:chromosome segregation ATPase
VEEEKVLTPEEKTQQYREMQLSVLNNFLRDFQEDEKALIDFNDANAGVSLEKQRDIEKREKEEIKRLEKQVFKKDMVEVEEAYANANLKNLRDRIVKTITEGVLKQQKVLVKAQSLFAEQEAVVAKKKQEIQSLINKKNLLQSLCQSLLDKNCELYMKHEQMLEEERQERLRLAANFNEQMKEVQVELDAQKAKRQAEINENSELRTQIQKAIDEYRVKESSYREKMDAHQKVILDIEKKLKATIEGTVTKTIKEADAEKTKFMSVCDRVKTLSDKINDYMKKFDQIKEEMSDNSKRFETYQA